MECHIHRLNPAPTSTPAPESIEETPSPVKDRGQSLTPPRHRVSTPRNT